MAQKEMKFKNSNLRFLGTKMDTNGNGCYIFKYPNGRAFTIQAHNFWNGSYFHLVKDPQDLFKYKTSNITLTTWRQLPSAIFPFLVARSRRKG